MAEKMSPIVTFNLLPNTVKNFRRKSNTFDYMACNLKIVFDEFAVKRESASYLTISFTSDKNHAVMTRD